MRPDFIYFFCFPKQDDDRGVKRLLDGREISILTRTYNGVLDSSVKSYTRNHLAEQV